MLLETLVIDGDANTRSWFHQIAMQNERTCILFLPLQLINWLEKSALLMLRCVDVATTTLEEQRKTDWLENESLIDFLDPNDHSKTIEAIKPYSCNDFSQ